MPACAARRQRRRARRRAAGYRRASTPCGLAGERSSSSRMLCADLAHGREGRAVDRAGPELLERAQVLVSRVTEVVLEAVLRITPMQPAHEPIAADLRQDRRRTDLGQQIVAVDDGLGPVQPRALAER